MKELMEKLAKIASSCDESYAARNTATCSGCCSGGSCCSNPVSG